MDKDVTSPQPATPEHAASSGLRPGAVFFFPRRNGAPAVFNPAYFAGRPVLIGVSFWISATNSTSACVASKASPARRISLFLTAIF